MAELVFARKSGEGAVNGLSLYRSALKPFQYSKQILKISTSSTSEIKTK
jgi:hypothetical protein